MSYVTSEGEVSELADCRDLCGHRSKVRRPNCRVRYAMDFTGQESLVQQAHYDQTDINQVVERYRRTGVMPSGKSNGRFADVTGLQGDPTELIERSREVIQQTAEFLSQYKPKGENGQDLPPEHVDVTPAPTP